MRKTRIPWPTLLATLLLTAFAFGGSFTCEGSSGSVSTTQSD